MGYAYTSDFGANSIEKTIEAAVKLAGVADGDEYRSLPAPQPVPDDDLDVYDQAIVDLPIERKVEMARRIEKAAFRYDERIVLTNRCTLLSQYGSVAIANSKGIAGSYDKSFIGGFVMAMAADENDRSMAFGFDFGSRLVDFRPSAIGKEAARKAVGMLGGKPVPRRRAPVVYSPMAATSVLGALSRALGADAMQRNRSFLEGKIGQTVAADMVSVLDNGRLPGGIATRPFDDEGVPTAATRLIDEGVLQTALHDHYTATRDGTASSTGNASRRSHASMPDAGRQQLLLPTRPRNAGGGDRRGGAGAVRGERDEYGQHQPDQRRLFDLGEGILDRERRTEPPGQRGHDCFVDAGVAAKHQGDRQRPDLCADDGRAGVADDTGGRGDDRWEWVNGSGQWSVVSNRSDHHLLLISVRLALTWISRVYGGAQ